MSQRHGSRHPQLGLGGSPCSVPGQEEEAVSSSQLQVVGLTRQLHSSLLPAQILPVQPPWAGSPGMQQ